MRDDSKRWRTRAKAALERYFHRRSFPRTILSLLILITGVAGFLISYGLLHLGVDHMWVRYPVAVLLSYGVLLGLIRLWAEIEKKRFDPDDTDMSENDFAIERISVSTGKRSSWFDALDFSPDIGFPDFDWDLEGCLPMILLCVLGILAFVLLMTVAAAPGLLAEVFLDGFLVSVLYRRLRVAQKERWLGTALRKTLTPALATAVLLAIGGWTLEEMAPGARSIGKAIEQIHRKW